MRRNLFAGLLAITGSLAALLIVEIKGLSGSSAPDAPERAAAAAAAASTPVASETDRLPTMVAAILARPLFEPSRRPSDPTAAESAGASASASRRLAGIIVTPTGRSVIFEGPNNGRPLVLAEGEKVDGYLIQSIGVDQVVVVSRDGKHVLHPTFDPKARAAVPGTTLPPPVALAAPAPAVVAPGRINLPGLTGRPLGLAANPADASVGIPVFPSLAAPGPETVPNAEKGAPR